MRARSASCIESTPEQPSRLGALRRHRIEDDRLVAPHHRPAWLVDLLCEGSVLTSTEPQCLIEAHVERTHLLKFREHVGRVAYPHRRTCRTTTRGPEAPGCCPGGTEPGQTRTTRPWTNAARVRVPRLHQGGPLPLARSFVVIDEREASAGVGVVVDDEHSRRPPVRTHRGTLMLRQWEQCSQPAHPPIGQSRDGDRVGCGGLSGSGQPVRLPTHDTCSLTAPRCSRARTSRRLPLSSATLNPCGDQDLPFRLARGPA